MGKLQVDGKEQPFFLRDALWPSWVHCTLGHTHWERIQRLFCLQSLVKVESHTKESSKRCQTVLGFRHGPEGCSLPLRCTLVRHPDHIMLSIFHFKYFRPSSLLFKPGFLWLNPESLAAALATVNRPRAEPKTCTKSGA